LRRQKHLNVDMACIAKSKGWGVGSRGMGSRSDTHPEAAIAFRAIDRPLQADHDPAMHFKILGEIPKPKPSLPVPVFGRSQDCDESTGVAAGVNAKALPVYDYLMARSIWLSYTGTKRPGSVARNSRSRTCFEA
jgi:hypothetical protein